MYGRKPGFRWSEFAGFGTFQLAVGLGRAELAHQELTNLAESCRRGIYGEWEFNEWLHGQTGRPMGKAHQAWSSAGYIAAYLALNHDMVPPDFEPLTKEMFEATPQ